MISPMSMLLLASATLSFASPISQPQTGAAIFARADFEDVKCPTAEYDDDKVKDSFKGLEDNANKSNKQKPSYGSKYYPTNYKATDEKVREALDKIDECKFGQEGKSYLEFPLMDEVYSGGSPGNDRVIAIAEGPKPFKNFVYCLSVGHKSLEDKTFEVCEED